MVDKVVLINTIQRKHDGSPSFWIEPAYNNVGLLTIEEGLKTAGFKGEVVYFPERGVTYSENSLDELARQFKEFIGNDEVIFGIHAPTEKYDMMIAFSKFLRQYFPDSERFAGGPHFHRENFGFDDTVDEALKLGFVDKVVVGHATPFIDYIVNGKKTDGLFWIEDGKVKGKGKGKYPEINKVPYLNFGTSHPDILIFFQDRCSHACDFCTIDKRNTGITLEQAVATLDEAFGDSKFAQMNIIDSNPLDPKWRKFYFDLFEAIDEDRKVLKTIFVEPSYLVGKEGDELVDFLLEHYVTQFFIGRDAIIESNAAMMGLRGLNGQLKTQEQLDCEKFAIGRFLKKLNEHPIAKAAEPVGTKMYGVTISYIITPFESMKSSQSMINEMQYLSRFNSDRLKVNVFARQLIPLPGTKLRQRTLEYVKDPEDYIGLRQTENPWKEDLPASDFIDQVIEIHSHLYAMQQKRHQDYFDCLRRAAKSKTTLGPLHKLFNRIILMSYEKLERINVNYRLRDPALQ